MTKTLVCDWFMPNEDATPVVIVLDDPNGVTIDLDTSAALDAAFFATFTPDAGYEVDPEMPVSEYLYTVAAFDGDVSPLLSSESQILRVTA